MQHHLGKLSSIMLQGGKVQAETATVICLPKSCRQQALQTAHFQQVNNFLHPSGCLMEKHFILQPFLSFGVAATLPFQHRRFKTSASSVKHTPVVTVLRFPDALVRRTRSKPVEPSQRTCVWTRATRRGAS